MLGDLGGDFCKEIYEPKMFGMHIRSVMGGLRAENVNTDPRNVVFTYVWGWESVRVEGRKLRMRFFRSLETLKGTFIRVHMRQK